MKTETKHPVLLQQIQGKKKLLIDFPIYVAMSIVYINILSTSKKKIMAFKLETCPFKTLTIRWTELFTCICSRQGRVESEVSA